MRIIIIMNLNNLLFIDMTDFEKYLEKYQQKQKYGKKIYIFAILFSTVFVALILNLINLQ